MSGSVVKTQVIIVFKLWRYWNEVFSAYEKTFFGNSNSKELLSFRGGYAKDHGIPVTAGSFEFDLAKRLRTESLYIIKKILPAYSVSCREQIPKSPNYLFNFFTMMRGGRVVTLGPGQSMLTDIVKPISLVDLKVNNSKFIHFLSTGRKVSIYEQYLMNVFRQIEAGESGLAIVYTIMILEWFANEMIESHFVKKLENKLGKNSPLQQLAEERLWKAKNKKNIRISVKDRLTKYFAAMDLQLPENLNQELQKIIALRNKIVHHKQTEIFDKAIAYHAVDIGMKVIDHTFSKLTKK